MIYNEQQWEAIQQASPHFETARHDYIRNAPRWLSEQIISVYEAATGKTIPNVNLNCAVCVLHIYQTIGKTYFADWEERLNKNKEQTNKDNESEPTDTQDAEPDRRSKAQNKRSAKTHKKGATKK